MQGGHNYTYPLVWYRDGVYNTTEETLTSFPNPNAVAAISKGMRLLQQNSAVLNRGCWLTGCPVYL